MTRSPVRPSTFRFPAQSSAPDGIVAGPDGRLWFTESGSAQIGAITTSGTISEYGPTGTDPSDITSGRTGRSGSPQNGGIGADQHDAMEARLTAPTAGAEPSGIAASGASLWFTDKAANKIVRISTAGVVTGDFPLPTPGSGPVRDRDGRRRRALVHRDGRRQDRPHHDRAEC